MSRDRPDTPDTWHGTPGPAEDRAASESPPTTDALFEHRTHETWTGEHGDEAPARPARPGGQRTDAFIGQYRILDVLGEGGMGVVYRAEQRSPRRLVAVKVIRTTVASPAMRRRFEFEAQVLARLDHPGIARIYEAVVDGSRSWFAMEHIEGRPLDDHAEAEDLTIEARVALMAAVCDAVHHAHLKGVIHRDLKPGNILVTAEGQPKVLDFGIARAVEAEAEGHERNTRQGQVVGTPAYMSPEQATVEQAGIDARSDVYALGVIAYELLSGELPLDLDGLPLRKLLATIATVEPRPLGRLDRRLRGDITHIVHKALEKDPDDRYQSAAAMADDLRRHLADEPVLAHGPSAVYQLRKFIRRNRALSLGALGWVATVSLGVVVLGALLWWTVGLYRESTETATALAARNQALVLLQARSELDRDPTRALAWLKTLEQTPSELAGQVHETEVAGVAADLLLGHDHEVRWGAVRDDGQAVTASYDGVVRVWPAGDDTPIDHRAHDGAEAKWVGLRPTDGAVLSLGKDGSLQRRRGGVVELARVEDDFEIGTLAPDGRLGAGSEGGELVLVGADDALLGRTRLPAGVEALAFDPGDGALVVGDGAGGLWRWDGVSEPARIGAHPAMVSGIAFSPDGALATAAHDGGIRLWEDGAAEVLHTHPHEARAVGWLDADTLVSTDRAGTVRLWERDGALRSWQGHTGVVRSLAVASTGRFATGGGDGLVRLWTRDGLSHRLRGHQQRVRHVTFSPDGSWLLSSSSDTTARLWRVPEDPGALPEPAALRTDVAWSDAGELAWVDSAGGVQRVIDEQPRRWLGHEDESETLTWAGERLLTGSRDGTVVLWDGMEPAWTAHWEERVDRVDATADGRWVAAAGRLGAVPLWRVGESEPTLLEHEARVLHLAFSPDDRWLATAGEDQAVTIWSLDPVERVGRWPGLSVEATSLAWSPDGREVAVGDAAGGVSFVAPDPEAEGGLGRTERYLELEGAVLALAWSPDGAHLAAGDGDGWIQRFDGGEPGARWENGAAVTALAWGGTLWSGGEDGVVRRWTLPDPRATALHGPAGPVRALALSPDGARIAAAGGERSWIWPTERPAPDTVRRRMDSLSRASLGAGDELEAMWVLQD